MVLKIRTYGDPVLREPAKKVDRVTRELRDLARDMIDSLRAESGVGLAAPQVGHSVSLFVLDIPEAYDRDENGRRFHPHVAMPHVLINPVITEASRETDSREEGCLSFPEISASIERASSVTVTYLDLEGREHVLQAGHFLARAIQHENDHLQGVLLVDRMSMVKKIALSGRLKRLKQETRETLGQED